MSDETRAIRVVEVIDAYRCAINMGENDGLKVGQRFLVYGLGKEITDPDSGENLGVLEIVRGRGKVTHVQPRLATLETYEKEVQEGKIIKRSPFASTLWGTTEETGTTIEKAFEGVEVGDYAKPI